MQLKNSKQPLVSVIVPFYNEEKHIEQCFQTLRMQTYPKMELIAVDDGSTDSSRKIAKKYVDKLLTQKHQGPGTARNRGAKIAKGKILVFVDADMYFDKNYVKALIKPILDKKAIATFTNEEYVANPENIWVRCGGLDNNIPKGRRFREAKTSLAVRAITKKIFNNLKGMKVELGYRDDHILEKSQFESVPAVGALAYHYNPENLKEIFESAVWIGKNPLISKKMSNLIRYSIINSLVIILTKLFTGAPKSFFLYKIVFDFGIFFGILTSKNTKNYAK